jgi:large subunit ribosomal protein L3
MTLGLIGLKVGMTQVFDADGKMAPVTVIELGPCRVLQVRTPERDKYHALQLGFKDKLRRKAIRSERGHVAAGFESKRRTSLREAGVQIPDKADCEPQKYIREFRLDGPPPDGIKVGSVLTADQIFKQGQNIDVIGTSKGRGYAGVMKRHNFQGMPGAHGAKKVHRQPGSTASNASNRGSGRPKKGIRMAGQFGNAQITVRNLDIVKIDKENNLLIVRGAIPGPNGGVVYVRPTNKKDIPSEAERAAAELAKKKGKGVELAKKKK